MSDSDYQTDAVDNAFKRALKKVAPNMQPLEEEESEASFTSSHRSEVNFIVVRIWILAKGDPSKIYRFLNEFQ